MNEFDKNDVIQITDEAHAWYPALLIVSEVKSYGVKAFCLIPHRNDVNETRSAFTLLKFGKFERIGLAIIGKRSQL